VRLPKELTGGNVKFTIENFRWRQVQHTCYEVVRALVM